MSKSSTPIVVSAADWKPDAIRYMQPKVNDRGGKSIVIISTQTGRSPHVSTKLMKTWGVGDYVDEKTGESDGKYSMSLVFPNEDFATADSRDLLAKMKAFENQVLEDAVKNSEAWFGEEMTLPVVKHTFFPFLKYSKDKTTKKIDLSKPPSIRVKVPNYNGRWAIEIYDTQQQRIFPCENENMTPMDFIPKSSNVACVIQCAGLWFGGKGWGLTWKLVQCVVKPQEVVSVFGRCHIELSSDEITKLATPQVKDAEDDELSVHGPVSTEVADSDADEPEPEVKPVVKKKVVAAAAEVEAVSEVAEAAPKKKIVKKKVVA